MKKVHPEYNRILVSESKRLEKEMQSFFSTHPGWSGGCPFCPTMILVEIYLDGRANVRPIARAKRQHIVEDNKPVRLTPISPDEMEMIGRLMADLCGKLLVCRMVEESSDTSILYYEFSLKLHAC